MHVTKSGGSSARGVSPSEDPAIKIHFIVSSSRTFLTRSLFLASFSARRLKFIALSWFALLLDSQRFERVAPSWAKVLWEVSFGDVGSPASKAGRMQRACLVFEYSLNCGSSLSMLSNIFPNNPSPTA